MIKLAKILEIRSIPNVNVDVIIDLINNLRMKIRDSHMESSKKNKIMHRIDTNILYQKYKLSYNINRLKIELEGSSKDILSRLYADLKEIEKEIHD